MNENITLVEILKDCPNGTKFYSSVYGELIYSSMYTDSPSPKIYFIDENNRSIVGYYRDGRLYDTKGECTIFPSKDQKDWSKFTAPWLKKERDKDKLIQELGEYKVKYTQEVLEKYINSMSNKDDERLRKTAIAFLKDFAEQGYENAVECIDWLEKQGEPNPYSGVSFKYNGHTWGMYARDNGVEILVDGEIKERIFLDNEPQDKSALEAIKEEKVDNEPKFKVGDWVVNKFGDSFHIDSLDKKNYQVSNGKGNYNYFPISKQDEMHLWDIQDAKDGDVLSLSWLEDKNLCEKIIIFKKYHSDGVIGLYSTPCVEGYGNTFKNGKMIFNEKVPYYSKTWTCNLHPSTKEQRDFLFQKIKEAGYEWDADKKELFYNQNQNG